MGSSQAWVAVYGLRNVDLRTLRIFVNCRRATDAYGGSPVQAYRNPASVSASMMPVWTECKCVGIADVCRKWRECMIVSVNITQAPARPGVSLARF